MKTYTDTELVNFREEHKKRLRISFGFHGWHWVWQDPLRDGFCESWRDAVIAAIELYQAALDAAKADQDHSRSDPFYPGDVPADNEAELMRDQSRA